MRRLTQPHENQHGTAGTARKKARALSACVITPAGTAPGHRDCVVPRSSGLDRRDSNGQGGQPVAARSIKGAFNMRIVIACLVAALSAGCTPAVMLKNEQTGQVARCEGI